MKDVHQYAISYKSLEYRSMVDFQFFLFDWCLFDSLFKWICIILEKQKTLEIKQFKMECLKSYLVFFFSFCMCWATNLRNCIVWRGVVWDEGGGAEWDGVWYCIVLYCVVLCCVALHCVALHCIALHYTALYCTVLHCIVLHCIESHSSSSHKTLGEGTLCL